MFIYMIKVIHAPPDHPETASREVAPITNGEASFRRHGPQPVAAMLQRG